MCAGSKADSKVYGDLNFCQRLGSTIFPFRRRPLSPCCCPSPGGPSRQARIFLILGLSFPYEYTRECLAIRVARRINSFGVLESMADVMLMRGVPERIRSDNGAEMTAKVVRNWLAQVGSKTLFIEPGSPGRTATASPSTGRYAMSC
jgi:hypothetical protein